MENESSSPFTEANHESVENQENVPPAPSSEPSSEQSSTETFHCPICLTDQPSNDIVHFENCPHAVCNECFGLFSATSNRCPMCRRPLYDEDRAFKDTLTSLGTHFNEVLNDMQKLLSLNARERFSRTNVSEDVVQLRQDVVDKVRQMFAYSFENGFTENPHRPVSATVRVAPVIPPPMPPPPPFIPNPLFGGMGTGLGGFGSSPLWGAPAPDPFSLFTNPFQHHMQTMQNFTGIPQQTRQFTPTSAFVFESEIPLAFSGDNSGQGSNDNRRERERTRTSPPRNTPNTRHNHHNHEDNVDPSQQPAPNRTTQEGTNNPLQEYMLALLSNLGNLQNLER
jgi:hypothetical protein